MSPTRATPLPSGWTSCSIGDITLPVDKIDARDAPDRQIHYIDISGIDNERNVIANTKHLRLGDAPSRARQIVKAGDVLFATVRPYLRNIASVPTSLDNEIASTGFSVLRPSEAVDPRLLYYHSISRQFVNALSGAQYGVSYPAVNDDQVKSQEFKLPPIQEQLRISAKIEELFSELDYGIGSLETALQKLSAYRQSLLTSAFDGRLTAEWRACNPAAAESREVISSRIQEQRNSHYQSMLEKGQKLRVPKTLAPLSLSALAELPAVPACWIWGKLGWMTCGVEYGTAAKSAGAGSVPVLRMGNIQGGKLDWSDLVYTSDKAEIAKYRLTEGDVLFNRTNSPELVGKTAVYRGERPALFAGYLIRVNQIATVVDSQYLNLFLNSPIARRHGNRVKTDGVNQSNINGDKLMNFPFPYCPIEEQREIVRILDERLTSIDRTELALNQEISRAEALRQSVLNQAFCGRLVAQESEDEPAEILLRRSTLEKEGADVAKKKNNRRKAA
ncbi:restriction endonuclease subunit S [Bradyrhizobium sp.]|jgi:type I restriction enzyme S subunit|uniref:restriction endonuclease subunit S n=1 Tax=Bradyrhizobium sp. TaxID=376 RepID=UPI002DF9B768|nr:restriction endonuclease subunit S [Bradyrhizobium sp.]